eukprot:9490868-Pyramimonas_sp.AAC.1
MISASDWSEPRSTDQPPFPSPLEHYAWKCLSLPQVLHVIRFSVLTHWVDPASLALSCGVPLRPSPLLLPPRNNHSKS